MAFFLEAPFIDRMQTSPEVQEEKRFTCNVCRLKFYNEEEFRSHANSHKTTRRRARKGTPRPATTRAKAGRTDSRKTFNQAIDNVIGNLQLDREEIPRVYNSFKSSIAQSAHKADEPQSAEEEKPFVCETCKMAFFHEEELYSHMDTHKENQHCCTKCDMQFADKETLRCHMMVHDNNTDERPDVNKYHCVECGKAFTLKRTLKGNQDALPQRCTKCYMKAHMLANPKNSFRCLTCRESFDSKAALTKHIVDHKLKKYKCEVCGKSFADREHLLEHNMRTENGCNNCTTTGGEVCQDFLEKKNLEFCHCSLCGRAFRRTSYLQRHILTHSGPNPYKCLECKKSFKEKSRLNTHLLGSCGKKRYQCEKCRKCFYQKHSLMMHYLVHASNNAAAKMATESEDVHECNKCDRAFSEMVALQQHQTIHSDKEILGLVKTMEQIENAQIERSNNVSNQYPTVAHILDSPPVNRTVVKILENPGSQTVMQIVERPAVSPPVVQVYDDNTQMVSSENMQYSTIAHNTQVVPSENVQYTTVAHNTQVVSSENVHYATIGHNTPVVPSESVHYAAVPQEGMRAQDNDIYQAVATILEESPRESRYPESQYASERAAYQEGQYVYEKVPYPDIQYVSERVTHPTVVRILHNPTVKQAEQVIYQIETQTHVTPEVRPTEEDVEKSKFQMIVQTMCNLLNSRSGS